MNSKTGNDKYPGTARRPIKSILEINRRMEGHPESILFAGGQVFEGTILLSGKSGTDSVPIIIGSYGDSARALIDGGQKEAIIIQRCNHIRIENVDLKGNGRKEGNQTNGLRMIRSRDCILENIHAEGFQKSGIDLYNCKNIRVLKIIAFNNGFSGINVMGSTRDSSGSIIIKDCQAANNPGDPTIHDNHSGNGILVGVSDSVMIDHCTATNNGWDMPRQGNGPVGIWAWESSHVTIQYCVSYRNKTSKGGKDGGGFDLDGGVRNSLIQYCLSYENQGAGFGLFQYAGASVWSDNVIRYCVSINDASTTEGAGSFFIWNGSGESRQFRDCYIYNNVAYNTSAPVISFENESVHENFSFSNNIFIGPENIISGKNTGST
ncbi:MAG: right-handed parallel beta-helix repeat-containing protein, partial [Bacteroidota bacterium]|nr:right-handed parallel beta-helix repeat-containing protein [Bacteroidota bacterium]